jgi:hypothetical protein
VRVEGPGVPLDRLGWVVWTRRMGLLRHEFGVEFDPPARPALAA